jgi:uncharacterized protein YjiS (DUF1127 family)
MLRRRPFLIRLRNHYRHFRKIGLSRSEAARGAWKLAIL